jgi:hypothetical protein
MGAFIESDAFFPILLLISSVLVLAFVSILIINKNKEKALLNERKNIQLDEEAQVQLIHDDTLQEKDNIGGDEVNLIVEDVEPVSLSELQNEVTEVKDEVKEDNSVTSVPLVDLSDNEVEIPAYIHPKEDMSDEYVVPHEDTTVTETRDDAVTFDETVASVNEVGEEVEIPHPVMKDESNEIPAVKDSITNIKPDNEDAFGMSADENHDINTEVTTNAPKEYTSDKTEILEFPDFDSLLSEDKLDADKKIINQANKYIESVMNK